MRLDPVLDSFYVLSSLWTGLTGSRVCTASPPDRPGAAPEVAWSFRAGAPAGATTAFVDVHVVPMDRERVLPRQTVLVEGGRITALGPATEVKVPAGAVRIDGRGRYLMPGLADMHSHIGIQSVDRSLFSYLANGVTTVRAMGTISNDKLLARSSGAGASTRAQPRLYIAAQTWPKGMRQDSMSALIAADKAAGYGFVWTSAQEAHARQANPGVDSFFATARRLGLPAATHDHETDFEKVLALGAVGGSSDHLYAFQDLLARPDAEVSEAELRTRAAAAQRAGVWITVTLVCAEYNESQRPTYDIELARRLVKALQDAGAGLLLGSDAHGGVGSSGSVVHTELASLVRAGLSPYQALATGTRNVAEYLGLLDSSGTVAVGKRADLVLLDGNPLADVRRAREPAGVMVGGRWFDRAALDERLLALPEFWFRGEMLGGLVPWPTEEQREKLQLLAHEAKFRALTDSLGASKPAEKSSYERLLRLAADALGAMHAVLTPEQREAFEPLARLWVRGQLRKGYPVAVPGIPPAP
jgi:imidazolonepropionase-like amidohydrolase